MHFVLQDQLLEEKKSALVMNTLPDLHLRFPHVRRVRLLTVVTLLVLDLELDDHLALQFHTRVWHFSLDCRLDLQGLGMRLCPDESRINQLHVLREALNLFQTEGEQLWRLWLHEAPWRLLPPVALAAVNYSHLLLDALGHVYLRLETIHARVAGIRLGHDTALAASGLLCGEQREILHSFVITHSLPEPLRILHRRLAAYLIKFILHAEGRHRLLIDIEIRHLLILLIVHIVVEFKRITIY